MSSIFGLLTDHAGQARKRTGTYGKSSRVLSSRGNEQSHLSSSQRIPFDKGVTATRTASHKLKSPVKRSSQQTSKDDYSVPSSDESETAQQSRPEVRKRGNVPNQAPKQSDTKDILDMTSSDEMASPRPKSRRIAAPASKSVSRTHSTKYESHANPRKRKRGALSTTGQFHQSATSQPAQSQGSLDVSHDHDMSDTVILNTGLSAPGQLEHMVTESSGITLQAKAKTPIRRPMQQRTGLQRSTSLTPKQSKLWDALLAASPTATKDVDSVDDGVTMDAHTLDHPRINPPEEAKPSMRLVDRLKLDSQQVDDDYLSDSDLSVDNDTSDAGPADVSAHRKARPGFDPPANMADSQQSDFSVGVKQTYSQTRSYLQENLSFEESLLRPLHNDPASGPSQHDDELYDSDGGQAIRSLHELRAAGVRKRFIDDMEAMMDDLTDHKKTSWSKRRTALMELCDKLDDPEFSSRLVGSDFIAPISHECAKISPQDLPAEAIAICLLTRLTMLDLKGNVVTAVCSEQIIQWLAGHLTSSRSISSIARDRASNMAKFSQESYLAFTDKFVASSAWKIHTSSVTLGELACKALGAVFERKRRSGQRQTLLRGVLARDVLSRLQLHSVNAANAERAQLNRYLSLEVLVAESLNMAVGAESDSVIASSSREFLRMFAGSPWSGTEGHYIELALWLQLFLNMTNKQSDNCDLMAQSAALDVLVDLFTEEELFDKIEGASPTSAGVRDVLLLILGLLINLAEQSAVARTALSKPTTIACLTSCFIAGQDKILEAESVQAGERNVAYGYLAVLLGNLCLDDGARAQILQLMPEKDMGILVQRIEEFIELNKRVDVDEAVVEDADKQEWSSLTAKLSMILDRLRR